MAGVEGPPNWQVKLAPVPAGNDNVILVAHSLTVNGVAPPKVSVLMRIWSNGVGLNKP
jgi:hypothetical protein